MNPFSLNLTIRWADLDPNGHVRHSVYYDLGAQIRIAALESAGFGLKWMARNLIGPVIFREQATFLRELSSTDEIGIDVQLAGLSDDGRKWRFVHHIRSGDQLCAVLDLDGAWLDLKNRKITVPPDELRRAFERLPRAETFEVIPGSRSS